jgi:hypothetical protein
MQDRLNIIKEFQYVTGTYPEMDLLLSQRQRGSIEHWLAFNYTYVVYLDLPQKKEIIRVSQSTEKYSQPEINFKEYILKFGQTSLKDLTYLCTLYGRGGATDKLFEVYNGRINYVNSYLNETYGRLVYKRQAIHLLMIYKNYSEEEAARLLRGLHDWDAFAYRQVQEIMIEENYNFYDLWKEYSIEKRVYEPMYTIAHMIFEYLKKEN